MKCVYCGGSTQVTNSRLQKRQNRVWRRRKCLACGAIFSSLEQTDYEAVWRVKSAQGKLVPFHQNKLFLSLYKSLAHREQALTDAEAITETIIAKLLESSKDGLLESQLIAKTALTVLKRFDTAAAVSYAAFHPS